MEGGGLWDHVMYYKAMNMFIDLHFARHFSLDTMTSNISMLKVGISYKNCYL